MQHPAPELLPGAWRRAGDAAHPVLQFAVDVQQQLVICREWLDGRRSGADGESLVDVLEQSFDRFASCGSGLAQFAIDLTQEFFCLRTDRKFRRFLSLGGVDCGRHAQSRCCDFHGSRRGCVG